MNADSIVSMLLNLNQESGLKPEDGEALLQRYPYFEAGRFALLLKLREQGDYRFQEQLKLAAVHCSDRKALYHFVERESDEHQVNRSSQAVVETLAASPADDLSVTEAPQSLVNQLQPESTEVELVNVEFTGDGLSSTPKPEEQPAKEAPEVLPPPTNTPPIDSAVRVEAVKIPLVNTPAQRKPRINWNPDQAIEAPNDILSQILAYPELGKSGVENSESTIIQEESPEISEHPEKKQTAEPRRFTDWLKTTKSAGVFPKASTPSVEKVVEKPQQEEKSTPKASFFNPVEMARKSVEDRDDFVTETLAKVYLNQGDTTRAIRIYHKLSLLYPEKSAYFAALVEKIVKPS